MAYFIAASVLILLILIPLFVRFELYFDLKRSYAYLSARLFGIRAVRVSARKTNDGIYYTVNNGEIKRHNNKGKDNIERALRLVKPLKIRRAEISAKVCFLDAATTCLISASLTEIAKALGAKTAILPEFNGNTSIYLSVNALYSPFIGVIKYGFNRIAKND